MKASASIGPELSTKQPLLLPWQLFSNQVANDQLGCKLKFILAMLNHSKSRKFSRIFVFVWPVLNAELADEPLRLLVA